MPHYIDLCELEIVTAQGGLVCWPILNLDHDLLLHSTRCYIKYVYFQVITTSIHNILLFNFTTDKCKISGDV